MYNVKDIRRTISRVANMLVNGTLDPKTGNAILYACNAALGAIRVAEQQAKLDELELLVRELTEKTKIT